MADEKEEKQEEVKEESLGEEIGKVTHHFSKIGVGVIELSGDLKVGDIMKTNVITIKETESVVDVSELMKKYDIGSIVVIKGRKAEGIITERDIIHKIIAEKKKIEEKTAKDIMSAPIMVKKSTASEVLTQILGSL